MRVDRVVTAGFLTGSSAHIAIENNVWLVGDDERVVVIDAAHDAAAIMVGIGTRRVEAILCTHAHADHINVALDLATATGAPIALHPADEALWGIVHPGRRPDMALSHGEVIDQAGIQLQVWHTPGHTPGGVCFHLGEAGILFSGDTLFEGGPGATHWDHSDFGTIIESIRRLLVVMPPPTILHTGHGPSTTIAAEAPHLDEWIARGH